MKNHVNSDDWQDGSEILRNSREGSAGRRQQRGSGPAHRHPTLGGPAAIRRKSKRTEIAAQCTIGFADYTRLEEKRNSLLNRENSLL
jgi:hypothetical protein